MTSHLKYQLERHKMLGSSESKTEKYKVGENPLNLEVADIFLIYCNLANNNYHRESKIFLIFGPNKGFEQLFEITPEELTLMETFRSEFIVVKI